METRRITAAAPVVTQPAGEPRKKQIDAEYLTLQEKLAAIENLSAAGKAAVSPNPTGTSTAGPDDSLARRLFNIMDGTAEYQAEDAAPAHKDLAAETPSALPRTVAVDEAITPVARPVTQDAAAPSLISEFAAEGKQHGKRKARGTAAAVRIVARLWEGLGYFCLGISALLIIVWCFILAMQH